MRSHNSLVRKRPRHFTDRLLDLGILDLAERAIEAGDDLGDRANIAQRDHVRCELPQLFNARTLFFRSRRASNAVTARRASTSAGSTSGRNTPLARLGFTVAVGLHAIGPGPGGGGASATSGGGEATAEGDAGATTGGGTAAAGAAGASSSARAAVRR